MRKKVIVSVINDLVTDQRVHRTCKTLHKMGFEVLLAGRQLKDSLPMDKRDYQTLRIKLLFNKGPLFYACFNLRLFFILLVRKSDLLFSNDLDTLLANHLVASIKRIPLIYDSHEFYTEVPELIGRKRVQRIWQVIENRIFPKVNDVITVNDSIASLYDTRYGIKPTVVRNVPEKISVDSVKTRAELALPADKRILILQGSGINIQRGAEEMVEAMQYIKNSILLVVGGGDVVEVLKRKVDVLKLSTKVVFKPKQPYAELIQLTRSADIGLSLDKDTNINYRFSLPNKVFDYINAGIPIIASPLVEIKKIIEQYEIGDFIPDHQPENIAAKINEVLVNQELISKWKKNVKFAASQLTWENEEVALKSILSKYV